jgi:hypothetical protein
MISPITNSKLGAKPVPENSASYFGILVNVIERMEQCSLIRYRDRECVVSTQDLRFCRAMQRVA